MSDEPGLAGLMAAVAAGSTVLTPNTELAAALSDAVERVHGDSGLGVWPTPRVRDFGSWLRERHAQRQLTDASASRLLSDIEERELWREVIDDSEWGRDFLEPAGAARAARRARRVMYEYGIPQGALENFAAGSQETQVFLDWNRRFDERCRSLDCLGADDLLKRIEPASETVTWVESPGWRPVARQWLEQHGRMLPPSNVTSRAAKVLHAVSPTGELAAMAEWSRANLQANAQFRAWLHIPDLRQRRAEVVDAMDAALAPGMPYAIAGGTPLFDYPSVRVALETLSLNSGLVPFERFSVLLRAPELHASTGEQCAAALLDVQLRRQGPAEAELSGWLALAARITHAQNLAPLGAVQRLQAASAALAELRGDHQFSRWVPAWIRCLELGPWALRHRWSSSEYQSAERFRELLAALATADAFFGRHSGSSAQRVLMRAAHDTAFQIQTGVPAIWVSGQANDPWLNYDGIWIAGYSSDRWPPAVDPVPLLPVVLQRDYGVIAAGAQSQLHGALELQNRWVSRSAECVFSHADPGDGRSSRPSPLLPRHSIAMETPPATVQPHWRAQLAAAPDLERIDDDMAPAFSAPERTRGVATLTAQSRCAFRGFVETRLRTQRLERPVPGFNDRERGDLLHYALEHVWSALRGSMRLHSATPHDVSELLDSAVTVSLTRVCGVRDPGARWRAREQQRMLKLLSKWLQVESQRAPFDVEYLEQGAQVARHAGLEFNVRVDRVDRLADGARVVIDYKTGNASADWRGERPDNAQLPLYALLQRERLVAVAYGKVNARECGFIAESERGDVFKPRGRPSTLEGYPTLAALVEVWSSRIETIAAEFAAGRAAVAPTATACRSCSFHGLCRVPAAFEEAGEAHE